jgi:hypothetical protein
MNPCDTCLADRQGCKTCSVYQARASAVERVSRSQELYQLFMAALEAAPGGVLEEDFRPVMLELGYTPATGIERTLSGLLIGVPVWDEVDEEGGRWWHLCRADDHTWARRGPAAEGRKKHGPRVRVPA